MLAYYWEIHNREVGDTGSPLVHLQNKISYLLRSTWEMINEEVLGELFYLSKAPFLFFTVHKYPVLSVIQLAEVIFCQSRIYFS